MPTKKIIKGKTVFLCDVCGFGYKDKNTAQRCQDWCSRHKSCSLEITKRAVHFP